jgi:hypothetical protein
VHHLQSWKGLEAQFQCLGTRQSRYQIRKGYQKDMDMAVGSLRLTSLTDQGTSGKALVLHEVREGCTLRVRACAICEGVSSQNQTLVLTSRDADCRANAIHLLLCLCLCPVGLVKRSPARETLPQVVLCAF